MAFWYKKFILAVLLLSSEIISFVLDQIGRSNRLFLVASFLLSAIGFVTTIYTSFFSSTVPAVTRSESEYQIIALDIGFSIIQLVLTFIQLIRVFLGAKSNNNNNYDSLYPLASAVISFVFSVVLIFRNNDEAQVVLDSASVIFRNDEEAQVVSDSASVIFRNDEETQVVSDSASISQVIFRNDEETQVVSDSASVSQVIFRNDEEAQVVSDSASVIFRNDEETQVVSDSASISQVIFRNDEETQVVSDSASVSQIIPLETPAVDDESAINRVTSTLRRRATSTQYKITDLNNFEISKTLTKSDVRDKVALPVSIVDHMEPVMMNGAHYVDLKAFDRWGQQWPLRYYTRPNGNRRIPVLTSGWLQLVAANGVLAGDKLIFSRHQDAGEMQYMIQVKRQIMTLEGETVDVEVIKQPVHKFHMH